MDADERPVTPDAAVDHELRALLLVDPSADFPARVRARIADEPAMRASWRSPRMAAAIAAVAVVVIAIAVVRTLPERSRSAPTPSGATDRSAESLALLDARPLVLETFSAPAARPLRPAAVHVKAVAMPPVIENEILIDAREVAALRALIRGAGNGLIDLRPVVAATAPRVMELSPIDDVAIAPIVIVPLEEGARQ